MARATRSFLWLLVILAILSPALWLGWKNQDQIETRLSGTPAPAEASVAKAEPRDRVTALGRIEPAGGIIRVAGPARIVVVVDELFVGRGDVVQPGQLIATVDSIGVEQADVKQLQAELAHAELELKRAASLLQGATVAESAYDSAKATRDMAEARLERAKAELARSRVRSPIRGRVLDITTRAGEKVGQGGIVELADTSDMIAVAEVYETDINRVKVGQPATIRSFALPGGEISGTVSRIRLKISRKDVLDTDPVADAESRVVEVEISLDDPEAVADLTNLRVDVTIDTAS